MYSEHLEVTIPMTLHSIFSKLRKQNKGQYLILGFCISLSVLLITSFALMYLGPTIQEFLPEGGDTRKLATLLLGVTAVGCTIFTLYASSLFFRYKSREFGILLALGSPKKALKPLLFSELALVTCISTVIGLILSVPVSFGIWKLFETFLLPTEEMVYRFGWQGFIIGIAFCIVLTLLLFFAGRRFIRRTDIMDILRAGQKTEMVKEIPSWTGKLGIILTVTGIVLALGVPAVAAKVFYINIPSIFNLVYFVALAGIYLIILSCVSQSSAGKHKDKYYKNLVSISMMRFTAKVTTKNMCVIVLLLFCCLFAAFFGMLYSDTEGISIGENEKAYSFHFPAEEEQITKEDIENLADDYDITLASYTETDAANLVISYRYRDLIDSEYVTLDAKEGKLALFFPESIYEEISGQDISVEPNTYKTITNKDYKETLWEFKDGLYSAFNPDTGKNLELSFGGTVEFDALNSMSSPFAYVLNDADYQAAAASLGSQYMEKVICFDVKATEHSYNFAQALQMEYVRHSSKLSDFMGNYDAWEDRKAQENGETYGHAGSIGLSSDMERAPYDWKYAPRITVQMRQEHMQEVSVYVMLCLYIFIIMLATITIMSYVRSITVATDNKTLFESLTKLGAGPVYNRNILKKQLRKIFQYPALMGCTIAWIYALFMSFFNDMRVTPSELRNLGYLVLLIFIIWGVLYAVYRRALHKSQQILGIL